MNTQFVPSLRGIQDYQVQVIQLQNKAMEDGLRDVRQVINVDTGALAQSTEVEPVRLSGRETRSRYIAGQSNINPKTMQFTSDYARFVERRFGRVVPPFLVGYVDSIGRGFK